jgi:prevent-host-death family protein
MQTKYSIAQVRNQFATLVREVQAKNKQIQVTHRGEPVAVILSVDEYERLLTHQSKSDFWQAYLEYKEHWQDVPMDIEGNIWEGLRDQTPTPDENPWL